MSEFPVGFWSNWIISITVFSLAGLVWLIYSIYFQSGGADAEHEHASPLWDGNLREGGRAPPMWWFWMILGALIFTVLYLVLYPGLGAYRGMLDWTQDSRLQASTRNYTERFSETREAIAGSSLEALRANDEYMAAARGIYSRNCAGCHGEKATGQANMFPNLRDLAWQWGSTPGDIEHSIRHGRRAVMAPWGRVLGEEGVETLAEFVIGMHRGMDEAHPGYALYMTNCVACHGPAGLGNPQLGAPSLADNTWLYGRSKEAVQHSIAEGRNGVMPAFGERLDEAQIRLLTAWLTR